MLRCLKKIKKLEEKTKKISTFQFRNPRLGDISYNFRILDLTFPGFSSPDVKQQCHLLLWKVLHEGKFIYIHKSFRNNIESTREMQWVSEVLFNAVFE